MAYQHDTEFHDEDLPKAVAYPGTSLHRVAPVTKGRRLACVLWVQSQIRDPGKRRHCGE